MKFLYPLLMMFLLVVGVSGQSSSSSPNTSEVEVIEKKWRVLVRNPALDEDPFRAVDEHNQAERDRIETMRQNEILAKQGKPQGLPPNRTRPIDAKPRDPWTSYVYEVKFKNNGQKAIRTITWEYVFSEPETKQELGRRQFISKANIDPGKTKTLISNSGAPPTDTINAARADKKLRDQFAEQIVIQKIEYVDGSIWQPEPK